MLVNKHNENSFTIRGNDDEIDCLTKKKIKQNYTVDEELKILRRTLYAIINKKEIPNEYIEYYSFVEEMIGSGKQMKQKE